MEVIREMETCRICGALLREGEFDICDGCFAIEREKNPPIQRQVEPGLCVVNGRWAMRHFSVEDY